MTNINAKTRITRQTEQWLTYTPEKRHSLIKSQPNETDLKTWYASIIKLGKKHKVPSKNKKESRKLYFKIIILLHCC